MSYIINGIELFKYKETECIKTDSVQLNEALRGGFKTGQICCLQAPTSEGKSIWLKRLVIRSLMANKKTVFITLDEEEEDQALLSLICMALQIDYKGNSEKDYTAEELQMILDKGNSDFFKNLTVKKVSDNLKDYIMESIAKDNKFFIIDYIGCLYTNNPKVSQYKYLEIIFGILKEIASQYNVFIATAMQTNRELKRDRKTSEFDPELVDENYMADSMGPGKKTVIGISLFNYQGHKMMNLYKNRDNLGKKALITFDISDKDYRWYEFMDAKKGF